MWDNNDACQENAYTRNGSKNVDQDTTHNTTESEFFYRDMGEFCDIEGIHMEDIMKKVFRTDEDAYEFYKKFGKYHGFGVRKRDSWKDEDGIVTRWRFFCNRQRLRDAMHYNRLDRMRGFTDQKRGLIARRSSPYTLTRVLLCDERYMAGMAGGYSLAGFLKKDAYNHIDKKRRVTIAEGDAEAALACLEGKAELDLMAMAWYSLTDDGMLGNMFWADGGSRVDYQYFGDVLAFDATYKKNKYRWPLNLELMVRDYRNNELLVQFRTIDTFLVMTTSLDAIEQFAALTYTKEVFAKIKREIQRVAVVNLVRVRKSLNTRVYSLEEYRSPGRLILVLFDRNMGRLKCRCEGWTKYGYPCAQHFHLFGKAMKGIRELCRDLECECGHAEEVNHTKGNQKFIRDPVRVRTKGAPKVSKGKSNGRKRKCTKYKNNGHTKRKCLDAYRSGDAGLTGCNFGTISDPNKTCADHVEDGTRTAYYQRVIDMIYTQASVMEGGRFDLNDM
ncbi:hypothetical protein Ahy_A10g049535 [Arachis hypogaea]|uniref:Uncharacterized protein n=1 Tax=Arachis hypogaea TaxID=3818 RepID=A0A445B7E2_ARAHY|nr:hypothetical protein Ahy_A10g049535 [Arachis hypogaea]